MVKSFVSAPPAQILGVLGRQLYKALLSYAGSQGWSRSQIDAEARSAAADLHSNPDTRVSYFKKYDSVSEMSANEARACPIANNGGIMSLQFSEIQVGDRFREIHALNFNRQDMPAGTKWMVVGKAEYPTRDDQCRHIIEFKGDGGGAHVGHILKSSLLAINTGMEKIK